MEEASQQKRKITTQYKEMATLYQEKERIKNLTSDNRKLMDRLLDKKAAVDNRAPKKPAAYHVATSTTETKKAKRIESLNLMTRVRESERIML